MLNPFENTPSGSLFVRMVIPGVIVFLFGFLFMGWVAMTPEVQTWSRKPTAFQTAEFPTSPQTGFYLSSVKHWGWFLETWVNIPVICLPGKAVNEFHKEQCDWFWSRVEMGSLVALIPFVGVGFFFWIIFMIVNFTYQKARTKIKSAEASFMGVVSAPVQVHRDFFSWFHCMTCIGVRTSQGTQVKVYFPLSANLPSPGQTLAVFDLGGIGVKRYIATLYAPHMAVFSG